MPTQPPKYEEAIRQRRDINTLPSNDTPPAYNEVVERGGGEEHLAPSTTLSSTQVTGDDADNFNDAACLCGIFCLGIKLLSIFGR